MRANVEIPIDESQLEEAVQNELKSLRKALKSAERKVEYRNGQIAKLKRDLNRAHSELRELNRLRDLVLEMGTYFKDNDEYGLGHRGF